MLERIVLGAGFAYLAIYLIIAFLRLGYPFELEWMEGGVVDQVARVLNGRLLYVHPTIDFVPAIYTPLYYYVSALFALVVGPGFLPLRLVSIAASLGTFVVIYQFVRRETGRYQSGLLAAGLFAATYRVSGAWFDIARGDSLFLLLLLLGAYWLRFGEKQRNLVFSAAALWLAFVTKQTAVIITVPLLVYAITVYRRRAIPFVLSYVGATVVTTLVMDWIHDGWFSYYVFELPARHQIAPSQYLGFWMNGILKHVPIAAGLATFSVLGFWRQEDTRRTLFYAALLVGCVGASWSSMLHSGGYANVLMPSMMALTVTCSGLLSLGIRRERGDQQTTLIGPRAVSVNLLFLVQFAMLWYNPAGQIPSRARTEAGTEIVKAMAQIPGDLYMPYHGYLPTLAGKRTYAHQMALKDVTRADSSMAREIAAELDSAYSARRFSLVILDSPSSLPSLEQNYVLTQGMPSAVMDYWPMTGLPTRPRFWYVPRN